MTRKPIVKLVRAVTLIPRDEFYLTAKSPCAVVKGAAKIDRGITLIFRVYGSKREGAATYNRDVMVYKIVGWRCEPVQCSAEPQPKNDPKGGQITVPRFMRTVSALEVLSDVLRTGHYTEPLAVRQQKEINELKSLLQDSMGSCRQYHETINSLREECALKAEAIDGQAEEIKGLRSKVLVSRSALRTQSELLDDAHTKQDRLQLVVDDITQRLEDFRDGE